MKGKALTQQFGSLIRDLRLHAGLSQEDLGTIAGLHRTYIGAVERGEKTVSIESANQIASALGLSLAELFHKLDERISQINADQRG